MLTACIASSLGGRDVIAGRGVVSYGMVSYRLVWSGLVCVGTLLTLGTIGV